MLNTIIKKEIIEAILSLRFLIATLLCLVLIPLGMYVNLKDYEKRLADYQEAVRLYQQRSEGNIASDFQAWGYRPPSVFSIFSVGLEFFLPNKVVTSREGNVRTIHELGIDNPQSLLFGKVDLLFNVSFVISLLALIFSFNTVTGEKEDGTLRLVMSNPVPRWQILIAKSIGNYLVLMIPFFLSILIALIVLNISGIVPIFSSKIFPSFLIIMIITLVFVLSMFNLGIFVSTLTHRSITSIVTLLFVWTVLVLSLPKISPMIAETLYPVKSQQVHELQKSFLRENLKKELDTKRRELYERLAIELGTDPNSASNQPRTEAEKQLHSNYDEQKKVLEQEYNQRINTEAAKLQEEYDNQRSIQTAIAMNLSRISPVSCFSYVISEVSATGVIELSNLAENANRFQHEVKENLYDKFIIKSYGGKYGTAWSTEYTKGFDPQKAPVPHLEYHETTLTKALQSEWVDILLLLLFNIAFFVASHVSFLRYDVR